MNYYLLKKGVNKTYYVEVDGYIDKEYIDKFKKRNSFR